jgi:hypothetical protein
MKLNFVTLFLLLLVCCGPACSPSVDEPDPIQVQEPEIVEDSVGDSEIPPPLITSMAPQEPGPPPRIVDKLPEPLFKKPNFGEGKQNLSDAKSLSQFYATDRQNPISNGTFERWEKPGPIFWNGNYTYKKEGDPPDMDITMTSQRVDGEWALRLMPKGTYLELWQDVKLPEISELEGGLSLDVVAYVRNPVREGFAIRLVYVEGDEPRVAEIYPAQSDDEWTRHHAQIELPANVARSSVRLYITRESYIRGKFYVDGVFVRVLGATVAAENDG